MEDTQGQAGRMAAARDEAGALVDKAESQMQTISSTAQDQGRELVDNVRSSFREEAQTQTGRVVHSLRGVGDELSHMADCANSPEGAPAEITQRIAGEVSRFADTLDQRGFDGSVDDLRSYARRRPGRFLVGAFAVGFFAGRVLRNADPQALTGSAGNGSSRNTSDGSSTNRLGPERSGHDTDTERSGPDTDTERSQQVSGEAQRPVPPFMPNDPLAQGV